MVITDCYKFSKVAPLAKGRLDCVASTKGYPEFEEKRRTKASKQTAKRDANIVGGLAISYGNVPDNYEGEVKRKADKSVSIGSNNLSSVFVPDVTLPYGYGDVYKTSDAILFKFNEGFAVVDGRVIMGGSIDVFICRGQSRNVQALYTMLCDGDLDDEIEAISANVEAEELPNFKMPVEAEKQQTLY